VGDDAGKQYNSCAQGPFDINSALLLFRAEQIALIQGVYTQQNDLKHTDTLHGRNVSSSKRWHDHYIMVKWPLKRSNRCHTPFWPVQPRQPEAARPAPAPAHPGGTGATSLRGVSTHSCAGWCRAACPLSYMWRTNAPNPHRGAYGPTSTAVWGSGAGVLSLRRCARCERVCHVMHAVPASCRTHCASCIPPRGCTPLDAQLCAAQPITAWCTPRLRAGAPTCCRSWARGPGLNSIGYCDRAGCLGFVQRGVCGGCAPHESLIRWAACLSSRCCTTIA
jgi:hypothetical protein